MTSSPEAGRARPVPTDAVPPARKFPIVYLRPRVGLNVKSAL